MNELQSQVSPEIFQKMIENNISSTLGFFITDIQQLTKITGLSSKEVEELKIKVAKLVHKPNKIVKAIDVAPWKRISTGCRSIDSLIRGGIPVNGITEIFGCSGVGKTQFCLQLALQVQLSVDKGGLEKGTVYICTEDVFPSKRFHQLANFFKLKHNLQEKDIESYVFLKHAPGIEQLQKCLSLQLPHLLRKENIGLVVIDSIAGPFRGENEGELLARSRDLIDLVQNMNAIHEEYEVAVVCINQVTEDVANNKTEPCLGIAWTNSINYRCQISRHNDSLMREFEIVFSPDVPNRRCSFFIAEEGLKSDG